MYIANALIKRMWQVTVIRISIDVSPGVYGFMSSSPPTFSALGLSAIKKVRKHETEDTRDGGMISMKKA